MKILWFSNTPSLYNQAAHQYFGGGWIESLEQLLEDNTNIKLAIAFFHAQNGKKITKDSTTYYPIHRPSGKKRPFRQLINNWGGALADANYSKLFLDVINDFKPDVIHIFGSEGPFGEIQLITDKPVVIHLQGLLNPSLNAYFPAGCSGLEFLTSTAYFGKICLGSSPWHAKRLFGRQAAREKGILGNARYVMGRTHWDAMIAQLYNPNVKYYHVDEVLRPVFYEPIKKSISAERTFQIVSTLSPTTYKGIDVVLRAAKQLTELTNIAFTWQIAGLDKKDQLLLYFEKKEGIDHQSVGLSFIGKQSPQSLIQLLSNADVFVHPSYIDNSPNSVCEAQMLGLPVIACDVGGLSTLITHQQTGILVPSNGVFELVHYLHKLASNPQQRIFLGESARLSALRRHNKETIFQHLIAAYTDIVENHP